jgi:hypothetical protein
VPHQVACPHAGSRDATLSNGIRRDPPDFSLVLGGPLYQLLRAGATVPFLLDAEVHVKFLLATPLLIAAELAVHQRMRTLARTFLERQLVPDDARDRLDATVESAFRLRNSVAAEVLLLAGAVYEHNLHSAQSVRLKPSTRYF